MSQLGQASPPWPDSAQLVLVRPGSDQLSPAQLGQACLTLGPARIGSQLCSSWLRSVRLGVAHLNLTQPGLAWLGLARLRSARSG